MSKLHALKKKTIDSLIKFELLHVSLIFWLGGILVGLAAVALAIGALKVQHFVLRVMPQHAYWMLLISPLGLMLIVLITRLFFQGANGSGIPQSKYALELRENAKRNYLLSLRIALGNFLVIPAFFCGVSIGREGPTVQVGASIMLALSKLAPFKQVDIRRGLIMAGGAAGIAAAFNTPLGGIVFAIEELADYFSGKLSATIVATVVISGVVCIFFLGYYTYFGVAKGHISDWQGWLSMLICSIVGGVFGGFFAILVVKCMIFMSKRSTKQLVLLAGIIGLIVAAIGILMHGSTWGSGYTVSQNILNGEHQPWYFPFVKIFVTLISFMSGLPGGFFAPTLCAGAGFGQIISHFFPTVPADIIIVMAMVSYFSGVTQSPITCFAIVYEMVQRSDMLVPLMAAALIAKMISTLICKEPIYDQLVEKIWCKKVEKHASKKIAHESK